MSDPTRQSSSHVAALLQARKAIDDALAALGAADAVEPGVPATNEFDHPEWVNLATAAFRCGQKHVNTMARIVRSNGLGRREGRDWSVDMNRVRAWQEGRPYPPLPAASLDNVRHRLESSDVFENPALQNSKLKER